MFVTAHAYNRAVSRIGQTFADDVVRICEGRVGELGTVAYIVGDLPVKAKSPDGSNGELVVAVAVDGAVETIYFRRRSQDMSPAFFGARKVVDMRANPLRLA
jgi:hypothetical protein